MNREQIKSVMLAWRDRTLPAAQSLLTQYFTSADRILVEYGEKAESGDVRSRFFAGQRELWRRQDDVAGQFLGDLRRDLFAFTRPAAESRDAPGAEVLALVDKDEYELSLALQTITEQAVKHNTGLYYALAQRLGAAAGTGPVPYDRLPAGPHQLARTFEQAIGALEVGREVLLALYTLFEREVIRSSAPWHEDLNDVLRDAGVLPHLTYEIRRQPGEPGPRRDRDRDRDRHGPAGGAAAARRPATGGRRGTSAAGLDIAPDPRADEPARAGNRDAALGDQLLGRIRDLLTARRRYQSAVSGEPVRPDPVDPAPAATVAAVIDSPQVQDAVTFPEAELDQAAGNRVVVSRELLEKLRTALSTQRSMIKRNVGHDKLSHFDEDTIDIVGMLFEQMLNDDRLGNTVKAVLSRLHTPYLKLAVHDSDFLRHRRHPARTLFDSMIEAGSHWVDEKRPAEGLFAKLRSIVESVSHAEDATMQLFEAHEAELQAELDRLSRRQETREKRTVETEKGQSRLREAREIAGRRASEITGDRPAPGYYRRFVGGPWIDFLTLIHLRSDGDDAWNSALALGRRLQRLVDDVVAGARPAEQDLDDLQDELAESIGEVVPHFQAEVQGLFAQLRADTGTGAEDIQIGAPAVTAAQPAAAEPIELSAEGRLLLERLPRLPQDTWVSFQDDGTPDRVVKLSWFNPKSERFLFVDRNGAKAMALSLPDFADRIDRGRARVLHDTAKSYVETSLQRALNALQGQA